MEEIRRSPIEVGSLSQYLKGFIHPRWLAGFLPSTLGGGGFFLKMELGEIFGSSSLIPQFGVFFFPVKDSKS